MAVIKTVVEREYEWHTPDEKPTKDDPNRRVINCYYIVTSEHAVLDAYYDPEDDMFKTFDDYMCIDYTVFRSDVLYWAKMPENEFDIPFPGA